MFEAIAANRRKSMVLVVVMAALLAVLGYALGEMQAAGGGVYGLGLAIVIWLVLTLVAYGQGDQIFLTMSGARKVGPGDLPVLWNVVEEMTLASGLGRMPDVYVIDDVMPNAFATGRSPETASVAVTMGLLKRLDRDELQGVIAHELGHIKNRDILLMLFAGVLMGAIVLLADVGLRSWLWGGGRSRRSSSKDGGGNAIVIVVAIALMILAPILARMVYFAVSRRREYLADASAAVFTRYPDGLARALEKISAAPPSKLRGVSRATAPMYIVNPLAAAEEKREAASLTATHPPITERVRILRAMSGASFADYDENYAQVTGKDGVVPPSALNDASHAGAGLRVRGEDWQGPSQAAPGAGAAAAVAAGEAEADTDAVRTRARAVDDFFYDQEGWRRISCRCGAVLKVPPGLDLESIRCSRCSEVHPLG